MATDQQLDAVQPNDVMAYLLSSNLFFSWSWQFTRFCQVLHTSHSSRANTWAAPGPIPYLPGLAPKTASPQRYPFLLPLLDVHAVPYTERWNLIPSPETGSGLRIFLAK